MGQTPGYLKVLTNRNFIFPLGIVMGFVLGSKTIVFKELTPYIIGFILAISTSSHKFKSFIPAVGNFGAIIASFFLNYIVYGAIVLSLAYLFIDDEHILTGMVIIVATPPAIAIIPFTINLMGDARYSITGVLGGNLLGIVLTPLIFMVFTGDDRVSSLDLLNILAKILIIPMFLSRLLRFRAILPWIENYRGHVIDYGYFIVSMTVIGLNRDLIIENPGNAVPPLLILVFMIFIVGEVYKYFALKRNYEKEIVISNNLMLTVKNAGFAAVVAMSLFQEVKVALPAALLGVLLPLHYLYQSNTWNLWYGKNPKPKA
jgi:BASS family bile acid:Na+ symporter